MSLFAENEMISSQKNLNVVGNKKISENAKNKIVKNKVSTSVKKEPATKNINTGDIDAINIQTREVKQINAFNSIEQHLLQLFQIGKLHHSLMLNGNYGIGKATFVYWLISRIILTECNSRGEPEKFAMHLELLKNNAHPDVFFLELNKNSDEIKIDQIRTLLERITYKSTYGYKFVIIDDIGSINTNGINAILKTLEEPPKNTFFFIINHQISTIMDTIHSRCNEINMLFTRTDCLKALKQLHNDWSSAEIEFYTDISENSVSIANILYQIDITKLIKQSDSNNYRDICHILNQSYTQIDAQCKSLSRLLKLTILEKIIMYLIRRNISDVSNSNDAELRKKLMSQNTNILKQFTNIKRFELPVKFI